MRNSNKTRITEFLLLGLECTQTLETFFFFLFLFLYILTVIGNLLIIVLFIGSHQLHSPMYFFLCHLSISDILQSTTVVPNLLCALLRKGTTISSTSCVIQFSISGVSTVSESYLLTVMSYDRFLAICNPLQYITIMSSSHCLHLVIWSWLLGFLFSLIYFIPISLWEFCGTNIIDHVYCDFKSLLELSCSDTSTLEILTMWFSVPLIIFPFFIINVTYVRIFFAILKISSSRGKQKTFSTCSSHLTVVCTYYGTLMAKYAVPSTKGQSSNVSKVNSLLYTVVTPFLNPIIYSMRNKEIRETLLKWLPLKP